MDSAVHLFLRESHIVLEFPVELYAALILVIGTIVVALTGAGHSSHRQGISA
jgi:hypothetical protein